MKREFHISVKQSDASIVELLAQDTGFSKQDIKKYMQKGIVWLEDKQGIHRIRRADKKAQTGNTIHCYYDENILAQIPPEPTLIADEKDYSIWNKPSGMLSQGSKWGDHCTIHRWIEQHYTFADNTQRQCYIVHRLDKATRGLIIVAHKKSTASQLCELFEKKAVKKHYYAIVNGELPVKFNQHLDQEPIVKPIVIESKIEGKFAKTSIQRKAYNAAKDQSLLDIQIETGRKHQIRIHLDNYGYPIVGDGLYGDNNDSKELQLQCYKLGFISPVDSLPKEHILDEVIKLNP